MDTYEATYTKYREFLLDETMAINTLFKLYIHIYNKQVDVDMLEVLNVAPVFFGMAMKAFLENSIIRLGKLYDKDKSAMTVYKFLNFVQCNVDQLKFLISDQKVKAIIQSLNDQLQTYGSHIGKLKTLRDSFLAHNDKDYTFEDDPWGKVGLTIGQINELIDIPSQIVNEIGVAKGNNYVYPELLNALDIDNVFDVLCEYQKGPKDTERKSIFS